jgi:ABC-type Fe3+/spermidine/putrescine transport system ATPase subunit
LARALVIEPAILLLDEPLSNLDTNLRAELRQEIRNLQKRVKITTILVTHDQQEAMAVSDRVAILRDGASPISARQRSCATSRAIPSRRASWVPERLSRA